MMVSAWYWDFRKNGLLFVAYEGESLVKYLCSHMAHYKLGWAGWCERHCLCSVFAFEVFHSRLMARWGRGRGEPWACVCLHIRGSCGHICQIPAFWLTSAWRGGLQPPASYAYGLTRFYEIYTDERRARRGCGERRNNRNFSISRNWINLPEMFKWINKHQPAPHKTGKLNSPFTRTGRGVLCLGGGAWHLGHYTLHVLHKGIRAANDPSVSFHNHRVFSWLKATSSAFTF